MSNPQSDKSEATKAVNDGRTDPSLNSGDNSDAAAASVSETPTASKQALQGENTENAVVGESTHAAETTLLVSLPNHSLSENADSQLNNDESPLQEGDSSVENAESADLDSSDSDLTLDVLPSEIFLHMCSFLDARFVIHTLSRVCRTFHCLIMDDKFWKIRIAKRWPHKYPAIPVNDNEFDWKEACIAREERHALWSQHQRTLDLFHFREGLFAAVDCVHFMKDSALLAVGSRDRYLNVLNTDRLETGNPDSVKAAQVFNKMDAHQGWIWSACSLDSILATGAWDRYIKFWDMAANGQEIRKVKCRSAVLCTHFEPGYLLAGGYDKTVYHIDPRTCEIVSEKRYHRQPVLSMAVDERYVITASEDKTIAVFDRRADQVYKTLQMEEFVMRMSYGADQLWLGDKTGQLHLVDATDGDFNLVQSYDVGHSGKLTGVRHSLGSIITCSMDKTMRVLEPTVNPQTITCIPLHTEAASLDTRDDMLAIACTDACVRIWKPTQPAT